MSPAEHSAEAAVQSETVIVQILSAHTLFGRLELPEEAVDTGVVRRQYRKLALAVHPDKCKDSRAKEAFQALSEAFEQLSTEAGQAKHLRQASDRPGVHAAAARRSKHQQEQQQRESDMRAKWWDTKTWEEFEERLKHRERAEAALKKQFSIGLRARFEWRKVRGQVRAAERSVEHCDRNAGLPESELWPPEARQAAREAEEEAAKNIHSEAFFGAAEATRPNYDERPELDDPNAAMARLLDLMTHLRTVHLYCLYCGCKYDSPGDMDRNCPGITEEEHDEATSAAMQTSDETAVVLPSDEPQGDDPLEAYMASIDEQLQKEEASSKKKRRR